MKLLLTILIGLFYTIGFAQTQLALNQKPMIQIATAGSQLALDSILTIHPTIILFLTLSWISFKSTLYF